jgi:ATP-dependent helicase HrpB
VNAKNQLVRAARRLVNATAPAAPTSVGRLLLAGFPDRVSRLRPGQRREARMVGGKGVRLAAALEDGASDLFIAVAADASKRGDRAVSTVHLASPVTVEALTAEHPGLLNERVRYHFDEDKERVVAEAETRFIDLVLDARPVSEMDAEKAGEALALAVDQRFGALFRPDRRAADLISRLRFAKKVLPDEALPDASETGLRAMMRDKCYGERSLKALQGLDWYRLIWERIPYPAKKILDEELPGTMVTPAGSAVRLDYGPAAKGDAPGPVLACRLQALFGLYETPRIARGRVPLTLHLLAPSGRPCQVTQDLESFWQNTYPEVRKELKGRYPKHYWPVDPHTATPTTGVRPKQGR